MRLFHKLKTLSIVTLVKKAIYSYQKHIKVSMLPRTQNEFLSMDEDKVGSPTSHKLKGKNFGWILLSQY